MGNDFLLYALEFADSGFFFGAQVVIFTSVVSFVNARSPVSSFGWRFAGCLYRYISAGDIAAAVLPNGVTIRGRYPDVRPIGVF